MKCAFGVLQDIMYAYIIMHDMIIEDKWQNIAEYLTIESTYVQFQSKTIGYLHKVVDIEDVRKWKQIREDLTDYIYDGNQDE